MFFLMFMKGGGGGGTTTVQTVVSVPPPSAAEEEQKELNNKLTKAQIALNFDDIDGKFVLKPILQQIRDIEIQNVLNDQENIELSRKALNKYLRGDISITPEQEATIEELVNKTLREPALLELERFEEERGQQFRDLAAALGRGALDPVFSRELTKEVGRLKKEVEVAAGAEKAQQAYLLGTSQPLEAGKIGQSLQLFRQQLEAQRQINIQNLQNQLFREAESMAQQRFAQAGITRTATSSGFGGGGTGLGSIIGGIGGLLGGFFNCWVAEELYGLFSWELRKAREYMFENPDTIFVRLYNRYGQVWAKYVKKYSLVRWIFKQIFDRIISIQISKLKPIYIGIKKHE